MQNEQNKVKVKHAILSLVLGSISGIADSDQVHNSSGRFWRVAGEISKGGFLGSTDAHSDYNFKTLYRAVLLQLHGQFSYWQSTRLYLCIICHFHLVV